MATITLSPAAAAEAVCHDEQMVIWAGEVAGALSLFGFLRDLDYSEGIELQERLKDEIRRIVETAFSHPECRCVKTVR